MKQYVTVRDEALTIQRFLCANQKPENNAKVLVSTIRTK